MEKATYYTKKVYINNIFIGCIRDPETVISDFKKHIDKLVPIHFSCNGSNRIYATFCDNNSMIFYELPINYNFEKEGIKQ